MTLLELKQGINKYLLSPLVHTHTLENISIISSNCIGGVLAHDYKMRFLSPTVNLFMLPEDYIKFVKNLKKYLDCDVEVPESNHYPYPLGKLEDITLHFVHYRTFEAARQKWNERKKRVNFERLFLVFTDQNGCTDDLLEEYASLPYKKVFFTSQEKYAKYPFAVYMDSTEYQKKHNGRTLVDDACLYKGITGKRNYEYITDILKFT